MTKAQLYVKQDKLISTLSMITQWNIVLNRTVVVGSDWRFDKLWGSHLQSQSELLCQKTLFRKPVSSCTLLIAKYKTINWRDTTHFDSEDDYRAQVVETSDTVNNSPIQDYVHPDDHAQPPYEITPGLKPFRASQHKLTLKNCWARKKLFENHNCNPFQSSPSIRASFCICCVIHSFF